MIIIQIDSWFYREQDCWLMKLKEQWEGRKTDPLIIITVGALGANHNIHSAELGGWGAGGGEVTEDRRRRKTGRGRDRWSARCLGGGVNLSFCLRPTGRLLKSKHKNTRGNVLELGACVCVCVRMSVRVCV